MTRIWVEVGSDGAGAEAWCLDLIGFSTWAPTRDEVLAKTPAKLGEHVLWLQVHGLPAPTLAPGLDIVVEAAFDDEDVFEADREPATRSDVDLTLALMDAARADLVATLDPLPDEVMDWDPPYRAYEEWARWRTVREIVAHVANTETHYYARHIGMRASVALTGPDDDWHLYLPRSRMQVAMFLRGVAGSNDLARVQDGWSVRKALRRFVRHELLHTRSIRRIADEYE